MIYSTAFSIFVQVPHVSAWTPRDPSNNGVKFNWIQLDRGLGVVSLYENGVDHIRQECPKAHVPNSETSNVSMCDKF